MIYPPGYRPYHAPLGKAPQPPTTAPPPMPVQGVSPPAIGAPVSKTGVKTQSNFIVSPIIRIYHSLIGE